MRPVDLVVVILAVTAAPWPLYSQHLPSGSWTGTLTLTDGPTLGVEFRVRAARGAPDVSMNAVAGPALPVTDLQVTESQVVFRWGAFSCWLTRQDESALVGDCEATDGSTGILALTPSADEGLSVDVLTRENLIETRASNVYDALRRLKPYWIRPRGQARIGYATVVMVYIDRQPMGDVNVLKTLEPNDVQTLQFFTASEATMRFGTGNEGGAIVITRGR